MINAEDRELLLDHEKLAEDKRLYENKVAERQQLMDDIRNGVLNTPQGKRVIFDFILLCGYGANLFNSDSLVMAGNCAINDRVLNVLIKDLEEAKPGIVLMMSNEYKSRQANKKE